MSYRFADSLRAGSGWNAVSSWSCSIAVSKPVWLIPLLCVQWKTPDDGQRNCPKHVEFDSKNKLETLVHLAGFLTRKMITVHSADYCMCNTCTRYVAQTISPILQHVITNNWLFHPWTITWNYLYPPPPTHSKTYYVWWLNDVIHVIRRVHFEISRVSYRLCLRVTYSNGGCWLNRGDGSVLDTWHELMPHVEACEFIDSDTWGLGQNSAVLLARNRPGSFTDE
jgi:hypothetical protein